VRELYFRDSERFLPLYRADVFDPKHHQRAVAAIRARDASAAGQAMREHAASALRLLEEKRS
jgi:DNA-binding GntR family transcriptional regulator